MQNYHPALRSFQNEDLQRLRQAVREAEPEIYHDVTRWRFRSIEQAMLDAGLSAEEASAGAHAAMINFAKWRSRIDVPQQTHDTLKQLAKKWPLVAITNGNAQPELFGLGDYFEFVLRAWPARALKTVQRYVLFGCGKTQRADRRDLTCWGRSHH